MSRRPVHRKVWRAIGQKRPAGPLLQSPESSTARIFGYARVSTQDQNLDVQLTALRGNGAQDLFVEKVSAVSAKRPMFDLMLKTAEQGDTILFHSLSRMGREAAKVITLLNDLTDRGIAWRSLTEPQLDATTPIGKFMVTMTGAKDQLERDQAVERTLRGMAERKRQGMWLGRTPKVSPADVQTMLNLRKTISVERIARRFKVKPSTVYARTNELKKQRRRA